MQFFYLKKSQWFSIALENNSSEGGGGWGGRREADGVKGVKYVATFKN